MVSECDERGSRFGPAFISGSPSGAVLVETHTRSFEAGRKMAVPSRHPAQEAGEPDS